MGGFGKGAGKAMLTPMIPAKGAKGAKGKGKSNPLNDIDPSLKVWIGSVPEGVTWKELQEHFEVVGKARWAEILPKGVACVAYKTAEEAQAAIEALNGSELGGAVIEVDTWEKKPSKGGAKSAGKGKAGGKGKVTPIWQPMMQKSSWGMMKGAFAMDKGKGKGKGKGKSKSNPLNKIDPSLKVWVGNVATSVKWKELEELFKTVGETQWAEILPKGVACVAYKTEEEAAAALSLTGSELGGEAIEVDVWEQKPKKEA